MHTVGKGERIGLLHFVRKLTGGITAVVTQRIGALADILTAAEMRAKHPDRMIKEAVWGMLPKNNIARKMMTRVKVFAAEADKGMLAAQKPVEIKL